MEILKEFWMESWTAFWKVSSMAFVMGFEKETLKAFGMESLTVIQKGS